MRANCVSSLFASIMSILDPEEEPTEADLRRMSTIDKELREFAAQFELKYRQTEGNV